MNTKTIKKLKRVIPVSFIVLFAVFLAIPNTGLYRGEKNARLIAQTENRRITPRPTQSLKSKEFYEQFEKWYQDRLRYRDTAIKLWRQGNLHIGVILNSSIIVGKNKWLLDKNACLRNFVDAENKIKKIKALQDYCNKHNKSFILLVPPNKESVYRDYFPEQIQLNYKTPEYFQIESENLFKKYQINYLSVTDLIATQRQTEKHDLYFSDDHHWSYFAASAAADMLMQKLNKELHTNFYQGLKFDGTSKIATKEHSYATKLALNYTDKTIAPWSNNYTNEIYISDSYTNKIEKAKTVVANNYLWERMLKGEGIVINKTINNNISLLILGDSYSSYMVPYLSQNVKKIITTHYRDCIENKKEVNTQKLFKKYDPDAVVLIINETNFFHSSSENIFHNLKF